VTTLVTFLVIRGGRAVLDADEAQKAISALVGPLDGLARMVEPDGAGGWNVEASDEEAAHLRVWGQWLVIGQVGGVTFECAAEMP
jgi:hypothetical protein